MQNKEAKWWKKDQNGQIQCLLCPRYCKIPENHNGFCFVRKNEGGALYSKVYGYPYGFAIDPIEKKPLYHFKPGSEILSFGTIGCNLGCKFCQNWSLSRAKDFSSTASYYSPDVILEILKERRIASIAFTYNEPIIFGEYLSDISQLTNATGISNIMVSNGYVSKEAREQIFQNIDAINVDLKAFTTKFYKEKTFAQLQPVLDNLIWLKNETDIWIEITNLIISGKNDQIEEQKKMIAWILKNLGDCVPLHFSAFHPDYKMTDTPATSASQVIQAKELANKMGIKYCYTGNINYPVGQSTYCPNCNEKLIDRDWFSVKILNLNGNRCTKCNQQINGYFEK
jgi:pyruvate formate lyase activating enzyme